MDDQDLGFPKWMYSSSGSKLFQDAKQLESTKGQWFESPALVPKVAEDLDAVEKERQQLTHNVVATEIDSFVEAKKRDRPKKVE